MKTNYSSGKVGLTGALLITLTGCTTYVQQSPQPTVYTPAPAPVYVQQPAPPPPQPAPAVVVIQREDDFYQPLSPYGEWVVVGGYGRCWRPARVEVGWRPYANGHWELTDAGWYWVSDEPWGWATYHYGRWEMAANFGWIWVPQIEWAPAWVSWREGGGYVGWAPLPPRPRSGISINVTVAPASFVFVETRRMREPVRPTTVIVNNTTVINKTVNITKTKIVNKNVVINEGPRVEEVEQVTGQKIQAVSNRELRHRQEESVAEKHPNLKRFEAVTQPPQQRGVEPREATPNPQPIGRNQNRVNTEPTPVPQPAPRETQKRSRREQGQPEAVPAPTPEVQTAPTTPVVPLREVHPNPGRGNQERVIREQNPPTNPAPQNPPPVEHPTEQIKALRNRDRAPGRLQPEAQRPILVETQHPNGKPAKQKDEPGAGKEKNPKAQSQQADGTNTTDKVKGGKP